MVINLTEGNVGSIYMITEVAAGTPCQECKPCMRLRMMEMCLLPGERIKIEAHSLGIWRISILGDFGDDPSSTIAMRDDEAVRIFIDA